MLMACYSCNACMLFKEQKERDGGVISKTVIISFDNMEEITFQITGQPYYYYYHCYHTYTSVCVCMHVLCSTHNCG